MADWSCPFEDPITLPDGGQLVTLLDAGNYITGLPKADQQLDEWQTAIECLMLVVKLGGPTMFARIGIMRALNRDIERTFNLSRKDTHWGRRKLRGTNDKPGPEPSQPLLIEPDGLRAVK